MSVRSPHPEQPRLNLEPPETGACPPGEAAEVVPHPASRPSAPPDEPAPAPPARSRSRRWVHRAWLVVYVIFCLELGFLLILLPWTQYWTSNTLLASLPWLRPILGHNFVRGVVSGLGLLDLWIGISGAVSYRDPAP